MQSSKSLFQTARTPAVPSLCFCADILQYLFSNTKEYRCYLVVWNLCNILKNPFLHLCTNNISHRPFAMYMFMCVYLCVFVCACMFCLCICVCCRFVCICVCPVCMYVLCLCVLVCMHVFLPLALVGKH